MSGMVEITKKNKTEEEKSKMAAFNNNGFLWEWLGDWLGVVWKSVASLHSDRKCCSKIWTGGIKNLKKWEEIAE